MSPYVAAYRAQFGEPLARSAYGRMARVLRQLEDLQPPAEVLLRFTRYLLATPPRYYSVEHFAATFPAWRTGAVDSADRTAPRPGESTDAYIARLTR